MAKRSDYFDVHSELRRELSARVDFYSFILSLDSTQISDISCSELFDMLNEYEWAAASWFETRCKDLNIEADKVSLLNYLKISGRV